jgi:hypothetical protein
MDFCSISLWISTPFEVVVKLLFTEAIGNYLVKTLNNVLNSA